MTIITKTVIKPKTENVNAAPLVDDKCTVVIDGKDINDSVSSIPGPINRSVCGLTMFKLVYVVMFLILFLCALSLLGSILEPTEKPSETYFKSWSEMPMPQFQDSDVKQDDEYIAATNQLDRFWTQIFKEYVEIDQNVESIDVPDFKGKKGRFIHDFYMNVSAIVDPATGRCFVMPLNRSAVLPPTSLRDALTKMQQGYYNLDMSVVRQNYKAVFPAVTDFSEFGQYIPNECGSHSTYRLEKINREILKRSIVPAKKSVFGHYAGKSFQEFTISNIADVEKYEKTQH